MLALGVATFSVLGVLLVLLGVHQAEMARDLSLDMAASGFLGAVLSLGFGAGMTAVGPIVDRLPRKPVFMLACLLASVALLSVGPQMGFARVATHLGLLGFGGGCYVTLLNASVIQTSSSKPAAMLAGLHASATLGATVGPFLIAWGTRGAPSSWVLTFHALGYAHLALGALGALRRFPDAAPRAESDHAAAPGEGVRGGWFSPALVALAAVAFFYVGAENGLTLFSVPWAQSEGRGEAAGRAGISAFWFGLMAGRLMVVALSQRIAPGARLLVLCGLGGALWIALALAFAFPPALALGVCGLALGPVYPVTIALTGRRFPRAVGTASGLVAGAGAGGGFCLPWVSGAVGDASSAAFAIAVLGASVLLIAIAAFSFARQPA